VSRFFLPDAAATDSIESRSSMMEAWGAGSDDFSDAKQKGLHFWKPYVCWCREPEMKFI